jgi:hypothetical protein
MLKTANPTPDKPTPPPTDRALIGAFIAEGVKYADHAKTAQPDAEYWRAIGHAEARAELEAMLEGNRKAREAYVKDAGDRIVKAATDAGKAVAELVNKLHAKAEERADQDHQ